jgi:hypothetical protein
MKIGLIKLRRDKMTDKIWIECICDYVGWAEMVRPDGWEYDHPMCPECGELIDNVQELSKEDWINKTKKG